VAGEILRWLLIPIKNSGGAAVHDGMALIHKRVIPNGALHTNGEMGTSFGIRYSKSLAKYNNIPVCWEVANKTKSVKDRFSPYHKTNE